MSQVTAYTDTDAIRASIGVDSQDCPDDMIVSSNIHLELETDLQEWLPDHATIFTEGNSSSATAEQVLKRNYLALYAQYFCGYQLALRPLTFPQIVSDGKNQLNRFSKLDLKDVADAAADKMNKFKGKLDELHNSAPVADLPIMGVAAPDFDPVTGV